jgi:aspartyl/asparaginyl beta-hydroxylase (cupin superfamily)
MGIQTLFVQKTFSFIRTYKNKWFQKLLTIFKEYLRNAGYEIALDWFVTLNRYGVSVIIILYYQPIKKASISFYHFIYFSWLQIVKKLKLLHEIVSKKAHFVISECIFNLFDHSRWTIYVLKFWDNEILYHSLYS